MTRVIAEIGQSHGWDFAEAIRYVRLAKQAGADVAKFQCHRGNPLKPDCPDFNDWQWGALRVECDDAEIGFLVSPFSLEAAQMLDGMVIAWKVASGQVTNTDMLDFINSTGKPTLVSRGLGTFWELQACADILSDVDLTWMLCESTYPTPPNLWLTPDPTCGYSDHSGSMFPGLWAGLVGCPYVEVHVKDEASKGNDLDSSITYEELAYLTHGIKMYQARQGFRSQPLKHEMREKYLGT